MEAFYTLMNIDRDVLEVWGSAYDIRELLRATYYAVDKKKINKIDLSWKEKIIIKKALSEVKDNDIYQWIKDSGLL